MEIPPPPTHTHTNTHHHGNMHTHHHGNMHTNPHLDLVATINHLGILLSQPNGTILEGSEDRRCHVDVVAVQFAVTEKSACQ